MNLWPKAVEICEGFLIPIIVPLRGADGRCIAPREAAEECDFYKSDGNCEKRFFWRRSGGLTPGREDAHPPRRALSPGLACVTEP